MKDGKAPSDVSQWTYGSWHVVDIEHPLAGYLPIIGRIAGTGPQPLSGDTTTVKQVGRDFGPSQRFTMDWNNIDGSTEDIVLGESSDPYSPISATSGPTTTREALSRCRSPRKRWLRRRPTPCACCHERIAHSRSAPQAWVPHPRDVFVFVARVGNHQPRHASLSSAHRSQRSALP